VTFGDRFSVLKSKFHCFQKYKFSGADCPQYVNHYYNWGQGGYVFARIGISLILVVFTILICFGFSLLGQYLLNLKLSSSPYENDCLAFEDTKLETLNINNTIIRYCFCSKLSLKDIFYSKEKLWEYCYK